MFRECLAGRPYPRDTCETQLSLSYFNSLHSNHVQGTCITSRDAYSRATRKTVYFTKLSFLIHTICTHTIYTPIIHICWGVLLKENPSNKHWELEIVIPTILYIITYGFSSTPTSPFPYTWEVDSLNTYHTLLECQVWFWWYWEALEETRLWQMQSGILRDPES